MSEEQQLTAIVFSMSRLSEEISQNFGESSYIQRVSNLKTLEQLFLVFYKLDTCDRMKIHELIGKCHTKMNVINSSASKLAEVFGWCSLSTELDKVKMKIEKYGVEL